MKAMYRLDKKSISHKDYASINASHFFLMYSNEMTPARLRNYSNDKEWSGCWFPLEPIDLISTSNQSALHKKMMAAKRDDLDDGSSVNIFFIVNLDDSYDIILREDKTKND